MAKRAITRPEEAKNVPDNEPITIDLDKADAAAASDIVKKTQGATEARQPDPPARDPDEPDLEKQFKDLQRTEQEQRNRSAQEQQENARQIAARDAQLAEARKTIEQTQLDSVVNAIAATNSEMDAAKNAYAAARGRNDFMAEAEAQQKIAVCSARLISLEGGREELEEKIKHPPVTTQQPQQPAPQGGQNIDQVIAQMPGLMDKERDWLRKHPDAIGGANLTRLQVAYYDATQRNIQRGSDKYFEFLDDRLGYQTMTEDRDDNPPPQNTRTQQRFAAPPSRIASNGSDGRITLSPAQREAAKIAGVDEVEYARQLRKMNAMKRDGFYGESQ
jgi:hypothetical protein